jgi:hypothetical protein
MAEPSVFDLFRVVQEHPDYVFGTIFVPGDFPGSVVPDDFDAGNAVDCLVAAGNEFIELTVGDISEDDWDGGNSSELFALLNRVREHSDYVFGTVFVPGDFPGQSVPEDFSRRRAVDWLAEAGNEFIGFTVGYDED